MCNLRVILESCRTGETRTLFFFCFFFFFSVKKKRSVTPCETGWLLWRQTPPPASLVPLPFQGRLVTANLQTPYLRSLTACTRKHLNINTANTGKVNNRRWQAPGGQRGTSEFRRTVSMRLPQKLYCTEEPLHRLAAVPLVLSGPLCPAGISPPRGESPLSGEAYT